MLFPHLRYPSDRPALRVGDHELTHAQLAAAACDVAARLDGCERVAVWAENSIATAVGVVGALVAGRARDSGQPQVGSPRARSTSWAIRSPRRCSQPPPRRCLPGSTGSRRIATDHAPAGGGALPPEPADDAPALIVYTSGTTGPPKGAVLPRRAIASNLDALATAWEWTEADVVCHALPLFHVHGLVLGTLGPLRRGGTSWHLGGFSPGAVAAALTGPATMLFAVPTMYHRLADAAESDPAVAAGLARRPAAGVRLGPAAGSRARSPHPAHRPGRGGTLRHVRDAHDRLHHGSRRAPGGIGRRRRWRASRSSSATTTAPSWSPATTPSARCTCAAPT